MVLQSNCALLLTIQFASLFFFYFYFSFFPPRFCPGRISGTVTRRGSKLSVLLGPVVSFCTVAYHPIRFVIFFFFLPRFCPGHISGTVNSRDFKLSALLLTIQFTSLISSLINIISLLLTTFDWTKVRGIAPRSHTGRPRTCLVFVQNTINYVWMKRKFSSLCNKKYFNFIFIKVSQKQAEM